MADKYVVVDVEVDGVYYYEVQCLIGMRYVPVTQHGTLLRFKLERMAEVCVAKLNKQTFLK